MDAAEVSNIGELERFDDIHHQDPAPNMRGGINTYATYIVSALSQCWSHGYIVGQG